MDEKCEISPVAAKEIDVLIDQQNESLARLTSIAGSLTRLHDELFGTAQPNDEKCQERLNSEHSGPRLAQTINDVLRKTREIEDLVEALERYA